MGRRSSVSKRIGGDDATGDDNEEVDENALAFLAIAGASGTAHAADDQPGSDDPAGRHDALRTCATPIHSGDITFEEFAAVMNDADRRRPTPTKTAR